MIRTPLVKLNVNNKPLNDVVMQRLMSLSVTDNKGMEADELSLTLDDHDGMLELPARGVKLQCWLGFVDAGTYDMGTFVVDSSEWGGSPDTVSIKARSADFKSSLKSGRSQSYHQVTLGEVAMQVAQRHNLQLVITDSLAQIALGHVDQTDESDIHLMTRLCHSYGAVVTIKHGRLLIFVANSNQSASGLPLTLTTITRQTGDSYRFSVEDRQSDVDGVAASYQDKGAAERKTIHTGANSGKIKKLKGTYKNEQAATAATNAEAERIKNRQAKFSINSAYGYPALTTETPIALAGFKPQVDALDWTLDRAVHNYSKSGGLTTQLELLARLDD